MINSRHLSLPEIGQQIFKKTFVFVFYRFFNIATTFFTCFLLAKISRDAVAAGSLISIIFANLVLVVVSTLNSVRIYAAHSFGKERRPEQARTFLQQGYLLSMLLSIIPMLIMWNVGMVLKYLGQPTEVADIVQLYFRSSIWSIPAIFLSSAARNFAIAVDQHRQVILVTFFSFIIFFILGFGFAFGKWGFPQLGIVGVGYAFTIQSWLSLFIYIYQTASIANIPKYQLLDLKTKQAFATCNKLWTLGWPMMTQMGCEFSAFFITNIFAGRLGADALAVKNISTNYLTWLIMLSVCLAKSINTFAAQWYDKTQYLTKIFYTAMVIQGIFSILIFIIFSMFPYQLASLFIDINNTANEAILTEIAPVFLIVSVGYFFDGFKHILSGLLQAVNDTKTPMIVTMITLWFIAIPLAYILCFYFDLGLQGIFLAECISMLLSVILLSIRWNYSKFRLCSHPTKTSTEPNF